MYVSPEGYPPRHIRKARLTGTKMRRANWIAAAQGKSGRLTG
jgi:hypothetical protein